MHLACIKQRTHVKSYRQKKALAMLKRIIFTFPAVVMVSGLLGCSIDDDEIKSPPVTYRTVACPQGQSLPQGVSLECGMLGVPESRSTSGFTRKIELASFRLSRRDRASALPMLYLEGGPGGAGSDAIGFWAASSALAVRDVIILDQRGTGLSTPLLSCPDLLRVQLARYTQPQAVSAQLEAARKAVGSCVQRTTLTGVDLRAYNSIETAYDVRDLRRALKIERWHVLGVSYGTRAALAVMRYANEGVASFVLDSVSPPDTPVSARKASEDANKAFERLSASCSADARCSVANGDLRLRISQMVERFDASPWTLNVALQEGAPPTPFTLRGSDLVFFIFRLMYITEALPALPNLIAALAEGRLSEAEPTVRSILESLAASSQPDVPNTQLTYLAVECNDLRRLSTAVDSAFERSPGRFESSLLIAAGPYCDRLPGSGNPIDYNQPVTSSIPTLLLAGEFDPVTLPEGTRRTGSTLSRSVGVLIKGAGHTPGTDTACGVDVVNAFLAAPESPTLPACADRL
jgi:pimeloyl-ACP methyl ester carboxylesterase